MRGRIVPVIDLRLRLNHPLLPYQITDHVIVLETDDRLVGLLVSEVLEMVELGEEQIQPEPQFGVESHLAKLVVGEAIVNERLVALLDVRPLLQTLAEMEQADRLSGSAQHVFCPDASEAERCAFRERARSLMEITAQTEDAQLALAVITLGGEYFGIELDAVQEFCEISAPTIIPCCPPHILGSISLRGNLITLLDLYSALGLAQNSSSSRKAIIARLNDVRVGIAIDEVHEVVYLTRSALHDVPPALRERHGKEIRGTASFSGGMMVILDLPALLASQEWVVNETV